VDVSRHTSLAPLAEAIGLVLEAGGRIGSEIFAIGALARDLWLHYAFGLRTGRATADVDFAVACESWTVFGRLRAELLKNNKFSIPRGDAEHKFVYLHEAGFRTELDIVPFGGLEREDSTIAWPPDGATVMNTLGFTDVSKTTEPFLLPSNVRVPVASLASLAALKLVAWSDRGLSKHAFDVALIAREYLDAGNEDRAYAEAGDGYDYEEFGAELVGRDMCALAGEELRNHLSEILARETDPKGPLRFASQMDVRGREGGLRLLQALRQGFEAGLSSV
jgi:predicted nucleotidyltransferase